MKIIFFLKKTKEWWFPHESIALKGTYLRKTFQSLQNTHLVNWTSNTFLCISQGDDNSYSRWLKKLETVPIGESIAPSPSKDGPT